MKIRRQLLREAFNVELGPFGRFGFGAFRSASGMALQPELGLLSERAFRDCSLDLRDPPADGLSLMIDAAGDHKNLLGVVE
jgi:hypothetical protein